MRRGGRGWALALLVALAGAGCGGCGGGAETLTPSRADEEVSVLLYERNLVADPLVRARMNAYVLSASRDGVPLDTVMLGFHQWLAAWAREHPDRVEAARVAGHANR